MKKLLLLLLSFLLIVSPLHAGGNRWTSKPPISAQIDWSHPLSKGLVGCWLFNEGNGLKVNDIAKGNNGTIVNGALWKPTKRGMGIDFDGTDDEVNCGDAVDLTGDFAIALWFYSDSWQTPAGGDYYNSFISKRNSYVTMAWELFYNSNTGLPIGISFWWGNSGVYTWNTAVQPSALTWHYLTLTRQGNNFTLYIDGTSQAATTNSGAIPANADNVAIGVLQHLLSGTYNFDGKITEVAIYNRALSPSEIQQLYQDPYCFIKPPTVWSMFSTAVAAARRIWTFN